MASIKTGLLVVDFGGPDVDGEGGVFFKIAVFSRGFFGQAPLCDFVIDPVGITGLAVIG